MPPVRAQESASAAINHVGVLYGLLGVVFATEEQVQEGGSGSTEWDAMVRHLSEAAYQQAPADAWYLPDNAFHPLPQDDPKRRQPDLTKARSLLGWEPRVPLEEGIAATNEYFRAIDERPAIPVDML